MRIGQYRLVAVGSGNRFLERSLWLLLAVTCLALLTACGIGGITQTAETERFAVRLTLDGAGLGSRIATIDVNDRSGQPVVANEIVLAPVMEEMGMLAPEVTAQAVAPGRYEARGEFFSMLGEWQIDVRVSIDGREEVARFVVQTTAE